MTCNHRLFSRAFFFFLIRNVMFKNSVLLQPWDHFLNVISYGNIGLKMTAVIWENAKVSVKSWETLNCAKV